MKRPLDIIVVLAAVVAALVSVIDAVGAGWWRQTATVASMNSTRGAARLAEGLPLALPEAVRRSRRLVGRDLATAPPSQLADALTRLAGLQRFWFHTDSIGFKNAALAAMVDGRVDDALRWFEGAVLRDPTSPLLHRLMAYALAQGGRREQALDHLAQARGLSPDLTRPAVNLTPEESKWVRAEGLERALALYPRQRVRTVIALARQLRLDGLHDQGRATLEAELPRPEIQLELAAWDRELGRLEDAHARLVSVARRVVVPASLRANAWAWLAEIRDLQGDSEGAQEAASRALALDPRSPAPYLALARLAERRGDLDRALFHLRSAWGLTPTDVGLLTRFSAAAEAADQLGDARLALERAVELDPDSAARAARLVDFKLRHGQYLEASLDLTRFLDRFPTDPTLLRLADRLQREVTR